MLCFTLRTPCTYRAEIIDSGLTEGKPLHPKASPAAVLWLTLQPVESIPYKPKVEVSCRDDSSMVEPFLRNLADAILGKDSFYDIGEFTELFLKNELKGLMVIVEHSEGPIQEATRVTFKGINN